MVKQFAVNLLVRLVLSIAVFYLLSPLWVGWLHLNDNVLIIAIAVLNSLVTPTK